MNRLVGSGGSTGANPASIRVGGGTTNTDINADGEGTRTSAEPTTTSKQEKQRNTHPNPIKRSYAVSKQVVTKLVHFSSGEDGGAAGGSTTASFNVPATVHIFGQNNAQIDYAAIIIAPDGGWGWMVVLGAFYCNFMLQCAALGVSYKLKYFMTSLNEIGGHYSIADMSWVMSLFSGFLYFTGPLASILINKYGPRVVTILGSLISASSLFLAYILIRYHLHLAVLYIFVGALNGVGFCFIYISSIVSVCFYFERHRTLATCISVSGYALGQLVSPRFITAVVSNLGWKLSLVVEAGLVLLCTVAGALFRPLSTLPSFEWDERNELETSLIPPPVIQKLMESRRGSEASCHSVTHEDVDEEEEENADVGEDVLRKGAHRRTSVQAFSGSDTREQLTWSVHSPMIILASSSGTTSSYSYSAETWSAKLGHSVLEVEQGRDGRNRTLHLDSADISTINNPLGRDDIFFMGTMKKIPVYRQLVQSGALTSQEWNAMSSNIPETSSRFKSLNIVFKLLNCQLFKSYTFLLLTASAFMETLGVFTTFIYLQVVMEHKGFDKAEVNVVLSCIGISNFVGRILCGLIADHPRVNVCMVYWMSLVFAGIAVAAVPFIKMYELYIVFALIFGLTLACYVSLIVIAQLETLGLENFTNSFGLLCLFVGFAALWGLPLCGKVYETTHNLDHTFYFSGILLFASGVVAAPMQIVAEWEMAQNVLVRAFIIIMNVFYIYVLGFFYTQLKAYIMALVYIRYIGSDNDS